MTLDPRTKGANVDEYHQTTVPGVFAAGNVLHVHDLVDFVSLEADELASSVQTYLKNGLPACGIEVQTDATVSYTVPQRISGTRDVTLSFRPRRPMQNCTFEVWQGDTLLAKKKAAKALPAVMVHLPVKASAFVSQEPVKVVSRVD